MEDKIIKCIKCKKGKKEYKFSNKTKTKCRSCSLEEIYNLIEQFNVTYDDKLYVFYFKDKREQNTRFYVY